MPRLTWPDLLIEGITPDQCREWLAPWRGIVAGSVAPVFMNKFGSWFFRRPAGQVEMFDVFTGELEQVADNPEQLGHHVNEQWWQEAHLFSKLVLQLHEAEKVPGPAQCYALCPHPALGGRNPAVGQVIESRFVAITDIIVWQSICAQSLGMGA